MIAIRPISKIVKHLLYGESIIRTTLNKTREATFSIQLPNAQLQGLPAPTGTGFFVSPGGWFVTAAHVTSSDGGKTQRTDIDKFWLMKEHTVGSTPIGCQFIEFGHALPEFDIVLLK